MFIVGFFFWQLLQAIGQFVYLLSSIPLTDKQQEKFLTQASNGLQQI